MGRSSEGADTAESKLTCGHWMTEYGFHDSLSLLSSMHSHSLPQHALRAWACGRSAEGDMRQVRNRGTRGQEKTKDPRDLTHASVRAPCIRSGCK